MRVPLFFWYIFKIENPLLAKRILSVGPAGFEPTHTEPKSVVLPLDDGPNFPLKGVQI